MTGLGSGNNGEWTFLDIISIVSFLVGVQNLEMNITQEDMQNTEDKLNSALREEVEKIHRHLEDQDAKIDEILNRLEAKT